jgi:hypothetical protein
MAHRWRRWRTQRYGLSNSPTSEVSGRTAQKPLELSIAQRQGDCRCDYDYDYQRYASAKAEIVDETAHGGPLQHQHRPRLRRPEGGPFGLVSLSSVVPTGGAARASGRPGARGEFLTTPTGAHGDKAEAWQGAGRDAAWRRAGGRWLRWAAVAGSPGRVGFEVLYRREGKKHCRSIAWVLPGLSTEASAPRPELFLVAQAAILRCLLLILSKSWPQISLADDFATTRTPIHHA